jgi:4'-phosphopantetheinyl transferase
MIWQAEIPANPAVLADWVPWLSAEERSKLGRFRHLEDQHRFLIGRGLVRWLVGAWLKLPPERVEFSYGPYGKPVVVPGAGRPVIHFNVAHSGSLVLLAFHPAHEVGMDVEAIRPGADWVAIAQRMLPAETRAGWDHLTAPARLTAFFQAWTRHEAKMKALGCGLASAGRGNPGARVRCFDVQVPLGYASAAACRVETL